MPESLESKSLHIQGTNDFPVPQEIIDYFQGKGIPVKFLRKYYGLGKSLHINPDPRLRGKIPPF